jgi:hypothetical protein
VSFVSSYVQDATRREFPFRIREGLRSFKLFELLRENAVFRLCVAAKHRPFGTAFKRVRLSCDLSCPIPYAKLLRVTVSQVTTTPSCLATFLIRTTILLVAGRITLALIEVSIKRGASLCSSRPVSFVRDVRTDQSLPFTPVDTPTRGPKRCLRGSHTSLH